MPVQYQPLTGEFTVNSITAGYQAEPAIAALGSGGFVVAWFDYSANPLSSVLAQRYDRDGNREGGVIQVSVTAPLDFQGVPDVVALDNGGFAIVWQSTRSSEGTSQTDVVMRLFNSSGGAVGDPFVVHSPSPTHQNTPTITSLADGSLLVTWQSYSADQSDIELWARRFSQTGAALGNEFLLTGTTDGVQSLASVAALPDGGFMVAWQQVVFGGSNDYDVYARRFSGDGTVGDPFRVNLTTFSHQMRPSIAGQTDGSFVIAWQSHMQSGETDYGIYAQRFDAAGNRLGGEFRLPSDAAGEQSAVDLLPLPTGGFLATWESLGTDGSGGGVYARYFDGQGSALGNQAALHSFTAGDQLNAVSAALPGGRIAAAWESVGSDGDDRGIAARLFAADQSVAAARNDFNGDRRGDMVLRDSAGWLTSWVGTAAGGLSQNGTLSTVNIPANWSLVGTADFNGDGFEDLLMRRNDGYVADWLGHFGGRFTDNGPRTSYLFSSDWKVAGTGDFDRDGFDDFLLRRDDGWLTYWRGQANGSFTSTGTPSLFFTPDWKLVSTGDFNGDGYSDILLRRDDGWVTNWLGTAGGGFTNNGANTSLFFTTDWKVIGTGDINGDGRDDLVLRRDDGWITDWLGTANGGFINNGANTALLLATDWTISSIADFNGDGREDILLRNDSGWMTNWLGTATGSFANNGANFSTLIAPNWVVQDPFM